MVKQLETELPSRRDGLSLELADGHQLLLHGDDVLLDGHRGPAVAGAGGRPAGAGRQPRQRRLPPRAARDAALGHRRAPSTPSRWRSPGCAPPSAPGPCRPSSSAATGWRWRRDLVTRLVTVAHGTRTPRRQRRRACAHRAPPGPAWACRAVASYVELCAPLVLVGDGVAVRRRSSCRCCSRPGHHVRHDLGAGRPLGPDPLLGRRRRSTRLLGRRCASPGQPVVMVAAGSRDPLATRDQMLAAAYLSEQWGGPVRLATLSGVGRRPGRRGDARTTRCRRTCWRRGTSPTAAAPSPPPRPWSPT